MLVAVFNSTSFKNYITFCDILILMERLKQDIKTGQFNRLYVLCGDDDYSRGSYKRSLKAAIMPEDDGMNYAEFSGKNVSVNTIIDTARTIPFFGERRLVIVNDSGLLAPASKKKKGEETEEDEVDEKVDEKKSSRKKSDDYGLEDFFAEIPDTTVLIFNEEKVNKASKIYKAAAKYGYIATFDRISEKDERGLTRIQSLVATKLRKDNMNITMPAWNLFRERTGTDLRVVFTELEKLTCFCMDRGVITEDDVKALIPERIENKVFNMTECMANYDQKKALEYYYDLLQIKDEKPVMILAAIYKQYHQLYVVKKLNADGVNYKDILKAADVRSDSDYVFKKLLRMAGKYTYEDLKKAMEMCLDYDKAFRSGKMKDTVAVELVIVAMSSRQKSE